MKQIAVFAITLVLCFLCLPTALYAASSADAAPMGNQNVFPEKLENGLYNLLLNGDFEAVGESSVPAGWIFSHNIPQEGASAKIVAGDAKSGKNFARVDGKKGGRIYLMQTLYTLLPGETYTFTAYMRKISGEGEPKLYIDYQKKEGEKYVGIKSLYYTPVLGTGWTRVEYPFTVLGETERVIFRIRLDGEAEFHIDAACLAGKASEKTVLSAEYQAKLRTEEALREKHEKKYEGAENTEETASIIKNGSLEGGKNTDLPQWGYTKNHAPYLFASGNISYDGSECIRISVEKGNGLKHPYYYQIQEIVGGAEYEIRYRYKSKGGNAAIKLEFYADRNLPGAQSLGGKHFTGESPDDTWHAHAETFRFPVNAKDVTVMARLLQNSEAEDAECMIDDISIRMLTPPAPLRFSADAVFYYADDAEGTFSSAVDREYYPSLAETKVDFEILDGEACVWSRKNVLQTDGEAKVRFPLSVLSEKEHPYLAKATLYDKKNQVIEARVLQIYKVDRPQYLAKDGIFRKEGEEPFSPVYAYHVNKEHYEKVAKSGINLVQMGAFGSAEAAISALDAAQKAGIMGFLALYPDMKPAGSYENIDTTIAIVSDPRVQNHPALFGYGVMDEVFLSCSNPAQDMENSYRLIRKLDKKHPILAMEAIASYYGETAKYADILCIDPYSAAAGGHVYSMTAAAKKAVQYEKPVYTLLEAYYNTHGVFPTPENLRNNIWQTLMGGADSVGFYSISDSDVGINDEDVPIWDARDGGALWKAICTFGEKEKALSYEHFILDKTPAFRYLNEDGWSAACWEKDGNLYVVILGKEENKTRNVSIPLASFSGKIKVGAFGAECLAGRVETISGTDTFTVSVQGVEALFYKITPEEPIDFSGLCPCTFDDIPSHFEAYAPIVRLSSLGYLPGENENRFAPEKPITKADFENTLSKITGVKAEENENETVTRQSAAEKIKAVFPEERDGLWAMTKIFARLEAAYIKSGKTAGEVLTRAAAAIIFDNLMDILAEAEKAPYGISVKEARAIYTAAENAAWTQISETTFCASEGEYRIFLHTGQSPEEITLPIVSAYACTLSGVDADAVLCTESGTKVSLSPSSFAALRFTNTCIPGIYVDNISEKIPRRGAEYKVCGRVGVYAETKSGKELISLYEDGETFISDGTERIKGFSWDETLSPLM